MKKSQRWTNNHIPHLLLQEFDFKNHSEALNSLEKALEIYHNTGLWPTLEAMVKLFHTMGLVYRLKGNYTAAIYNCKRARSIQLETNPEDTETVYIYNNLGLALQTEPNHFSEAMKNFENALRILREIHQSNHPDIERLLINMGLAQETVKEFIVALIHYQEALLILFASVPSHTDTARIYTLIGALYQNTFLDSELALNNYEKPLEIYQTVASNTLLDVLETLFLKTADLYLSKGNYSLALMNFRKALAIQLLNLTNQIQTAITYNNIGYALQIGFKCSFAALINYQQALKFAQDVSSPSMQLYAIEIQNNIEEVKELLVKKNSDYLR